MENLKGYRRRWARSSTGQAALFFRPISATLREESWAKTDMVERACLYNVFVDTRPSLTTQTAPNQGDRVEQPPAPPFALHDRNGGRASSAAASINEPFGDHLPRTQQAFE